MNQTEKSLRKDFAKHVFNFELNGLKGRYWHAPALSKQANSHVLVVIYGHHSSLERNFGLAQYLRQFAQVIMPDLPGLGGMESFYKVKKKPILENYADYLNDFLNFKFAGDKNFSLVGFSLGFLMITKFLQKYPSRRKDVRLLISVVGFVKGATFNVALVRRYFYLGIVGLVKTRLGSHIFKLLFLNKRFLRRFYARSFMAKHKFKDQADEKKKEFLEMEIDLWHRNDVRTWAFTGKELTTCDLTDKKIKHKLYHLSVKKDQFLDADLNRSNLKKVYNEVVFLDIKLPVHAPTVIADAGEIDSIMPASLRDILKKEIL